MVVSVMLIRLNYSWIKLKNHPSASNLWFWNSLILLSFPENWIEIIILKTIGKKLKENLLNEIRKLKKNWFNQWEAMPKQNAVNLQLTASVLIKKSLTILRSYNSVNKLFTLPLFSERIPERFLKWITLVSYW